MADYWIVNLIDRVLEVRRDPGPDADELSGWRYHAASTLGSKDVVAPLAALHARVAVADLLP